MSRVTEERSSRSYIVQSVDKAVRLLNGLAAEDVDQLGITELASRLGFNKNQVFRLLKTLQRRGFVEQDPQTDRYRLGTAVLFLAGHVQRGMGLVRAAAPVLDRLALETGETIHLVARHGLEAVMVDARESFHPVRLTARLGGRYPLHAGACPLAILAALPTEWQERVIRDLPRLPRYTSRTLSDPERLRETLERTRRDGYAISDEDVDVSARAVGAAILDRSGLPVGAISVAGPASRISLEQLHRYGERVRCAAAEIGARLGNLGAGQVPCPDRAAGDDPSAGSLHAAAGNRISGSGGRAIHWGGAS